jgi:RNA polymerase sigma-70 factor (ECF subfamily)
MSVNSNSPSPPSFQSDLLAFMPHLRAFARGLCHNRELAEDLVQETLTKAWVARAHFELGTNMKAWLFTILRHELYSHGRRAWRQVSWDAGKGERIEAPADQQLWAAELNDTAHVLHSLPDHQRDAVILVSAGGFSYDEAAEMCGVPIGTMKSRVARGRAALMETLAANVPFQRHALNGSPTQDILAQLSALTPAGAHRAAFV